MYTIDEARKLLESANVFFDVDEPDDLPQLLNMNDTWGWACADAERVSDDELPRVAELFYRYGWGGILLWVSDRRGGCKSEFHDNNRFIEFARKEEALRNAEPSSTKRAYAKHQYTIGVSE